ncbi:acyl-coenzyme A thioesterase 2, mitochondrial-like [Mastomys coucha]|uniref:acyl-coenzyme A thioesterase 2, mitochondrial-like n=1 Tax=Mastomys coucha TaxID=35658 RepID=UPI0012623DF0|nr:acyl-coenzyme A thioesterase 2, mitochondrial-like [Mastomys coucha]
MVASSFTVLRASRLCQWGWKSWERLSGPPPLSTGGWTTWARTNATLILEPAGRSCWDEPLSIAVRGLAPEQPVTLRSALRDEKSALFRAHARYRADAHGKLDLARAPALGGSFTGLEPMGLLWAMEPERPFWRLVKRDVQTPSVVELEVLDGHEPDSGRLLARAVHERHFMAAGVRRVPVREGRVRATLFLPPEPGPFPGIIDLFGVGGGLLEYRASLLAGKGFAVMALAYYNYDDLPKSMETMRIEYFEEAVNYLRSHPEVKGPGIGLLGFSKGGELGLAMASFLKGITAAVIINGSKRSPSRLETGSCERPASSNWSETAARRLLRPGTRPSRAKMVGRNSAYSIYFDCKRRKVQLGEELLTQGDYEKGVDRLTNGIAVCGQPQQLLQVLQQTLPPPVFQMLLIKPPTISQRFVSAQSLAEDVE